MKRWNYSDRQASTLQLFRKVQKRKHAAHHNHDIHFLSREIEDWLPKGIESLLEGTYTPQHLQRYYFNGEMVEQLMITDRIFQNVLLKQLKPTFKHIINPNCLHLNGPTGVQYATERICEALQVNDYHYIIRADIASYYRSILHYKLTQDIKNCFDDPKVQAMLTEIIQNPIETSWGYKNPLHGIPLRGPLSQLFSALYLKPLDDAFNAMVADGYSAQQIKTYLRRYCQWWVRTSKAWEVSEILAWLIDTCRDTRVKDYARDLLQSIEIKDHHSSVGSALAPARKH